jgi:uncharacterized protein YceK
MPGRWLGLTGVAAVALLGGGCGTFVNVTTVAPPDMGEGQRRIYGGVIWDIAGEERAWHYQYPETYRYDWGINGPMILAYLLDLPLSAIGDTLTLPITVPETLGFPWLPPWPPPPPTPPGRLGGPVVVPAPPPPVEAFPPPREVSRK